ncbi:MAG: Uma2 family endonuclease, partial [Elainellaceae cyanobacterium]
LNLHPILDLTQAQFAQLCHHNRDLRLERTAQGALIVMPPTGGDTGRRNFTLATQLGIWNQRTKLGQAFDSSTGFILPNGATRSPDTAWVQQDRWDALTPEQRRTFVPLCPDFAVALQSPSDRRQEGQAKLREYIDNGLKLGWLIDPEAKEVEVYRPGQDALTLANPEGLPGDPVLSGFILDLSDILD